MKLIITGASGYVATEVIRQSLQTPEIDEVVALARRPVTPPFESKTTRFTSVVTNDYGEYSDEVKAQLAGADACIWTVAITPSKSTGIDPATLRLICHDHTLLGLETIFSARGPNPASRPFRFLYMSGIAAERDQSKTPAFKPEYCLLRGETETAVLTYATAHPGEIEACVAKPGMIYSEDKADEHRRNVAARGLQDVPSVLVTEVAAAMVDQVVNGFEREPLMNEDLVRIGRGVLGGR